MLKWIAGLFRTEVEMSDKIDIITSNTDAIAPKDQEEPIFENVEPMEPEQPPTPKKKTVKKPSVNLNSMNKAELIEYAKKHKIKANSSMKKADILAAIKNG